MSDRCFLTAALICRSRGAGCITMLRELNTKVTPLQTDCFCGCRARLTSSLYLVGGESALLIYVCQKASVESLWFVIVLQDHRDEEDGLAF